MKSSLRTLLAATSVAMLLASPALALEKTSARLSDTDRGDAWRGASSCSLVYYNTCTGWTWIWSGFPGSERFGVAFTGCCPIGYTTGIGTAWVNFYTGAPAGYGFTGAWDVYDADAQGCPTGASLASQPLLPASGWNSADFTGVSTPDRTFIVMVTLGATSGSPASIRTDHPAGVGAEAAACGTCYPTTRVNHSFDWGSAAAPLCPGSVFNDGVCDAQLILDVGVSCTVSVEPQTWASVKALYR